MLGVAVSTLRRWHSSKKLIPQCRSIGGHRRYSVSQVLAITHPDQIKQNRINVGYARVSSHDQKKDLETQKQRLADYGERFDSFEVIDDLGSGLNYHRLCHDVIELMTVFSARLYGKRSHKNRKSLKSSAVVA